MKDIFFAIFKYKEKASPDTLGYYPERVHTNAFPERRYLWSSRMMVVLTTISIAINIALASLMILLLPQRTVIPRLLNVDSDYYGLAQTEPSERKVFATDLLIEGDITEYLKLRYTITDNEELDLKRVDKRSKVFLFSTPSVYGEFTKLEQQYSNYQRRKGLTRTVKIEWVKPLAVNLWQAQFVTNDKYPEKEIDSNRWRVLLRTGFQPLSGIHQDDVVKNPYGFVISAFYLSYVGKNNDINF